MPTTDEELDALRDSVESKREQLVELQRARDEELRGQANDVYAEQLKAEAARLDAQLAATAENVKSSLPQHSAPPTPPPQQERSSSNEGE